MNDIFEKPETMQENEHPAVGGHADRRAVNNRSIVHDDSHGLRQNVQPVDVCSHCADPAVHIRR